MYNIEELENTMPTKPSAQKRLAKLRGAFRRDWSGVKPFSRIHKSEKSYNRKNFKLTQED